MIGHLLNPRRHRRKKDTNLAIDTTLRSAYAEAFRTLVEADRSLKIIVYPHGLPDHIASNPKE